MNPPGFVSPSKKINPKKILPKGPKIYSALFQGIPYTEELQKPPSASLFGWQEVTSIWYI